MALNWDKINKPKSGGLDWSKVSTTPQAQQTVAQPTTTPPKTTQPTFKTIEEAQAWAKTNGVYMPDEAINQAKAQREGLDKLYKQSFRESEFEKQQKGKWATIRKYTTEEGQKEEILKQRLAMSPSRTVDQVIGNADDLKLTEEEKSRIKKNLGEYTQDRAVDEMDKLEEKIEGKYDSGKFGANYTVGDLNIQLNMLYNNWLDNNDSTTKYKIDRLEKILANYIKNAKNVGQGGWIRQDLAQHLPQQVGQYGAMFKGGLAGAGAGVLSGVGVGTVVAPGAGTVVGGITGAKTGLKVGATAGVTKYSYDLMRGGNYRDLISLGIPEDIARKVAKDEALWQAMIEGAETGVDIATLGFGTLLGKGAKTATQATAGKLLKDALIAYGINLITEPLEEGLQENVAIKGEKLAMQAAGMERKTTKEEDFQRVVEAGYGGFKIAVVMGAGNVVGSVITTKANAIPQVQQKYNEYIAEVEANPNLSDAEKQKIISETRVEEAKTIQEVQNKISQESEASNSPNIEQNQATNEVIPQEGINQNTANMNANSENAENRIQNAVANALNRATTNNNSKGKTVLGKINDFAKNKIQQLLGKDVSNRKHVLDDNNIRHILKSHGNQEIESRRGQIAVTQEDIKKIPDILENPTDIVIGRKNKDGDGIRYIKQYEDNKTYVVEVVPDKSNNLIIKTMWKKPIALADNSKSPASTSKTQGNLGNSTSNINNIIPNAQNYVNNPQTKSTSSQPTNNQIAQDVEAMNSVSNVPKDAGIWSGTKTLQKNVKARITEIDNKISEKQALLDSKKMENTKTAENLKEQIQRLEEKKERIKAELKVAGLLERRPEKQKKTLKQHYDDIMTTVVNKGHIVDQLAKKSGNKELSYKYDRMLGSTNEGHYVIGQKQTDNKGNVIGKSINEIWAPVEKANKVEEFSEYLLHKLNIERMKQGKPVFGKAVTAKDSKIKVAEIERKNPKFIEWSKDVNIFNKNQLQNMVDAGLTSKETQELLNEMYDNYIRINRQVGGDKPIVNKKGKLKVNSPIKKAKGGNQDILPLKDSMAQQAIEVKKAISRNTFGLELLNTFKNGKEVAEYGEVLHRGKKGEAPTFTVFKKGKPITMEINEELYNAIKPSERATWEDNIILSGLQGFTKYQKAVLTNKNIVFAFTNAIKDFQTAIVNSKDSKKMLKNYAYIVANKYQKMKYGISNPLMDYYEQLYFANGGETNTYFDYDKGALETAKEKTKLEKIKSVPKNILNKIGTLNEIIEQAPRQAEFITTLENKGSIDEAMYNAADITTNFKRGGELIKLLDRNGFSFLNASIQGLDKQIRNITEQNGLKGYANLVIKFALTGVVPSVLNHLLMGDDEDYEELPDYIKDNYWLVKYDDDKFIRIPKGRDFSSFIGTVFQRATRAIRGEENAFDGLVETFTNNLAPNNPLTDNVFSGIGAVKNNKAWHGGEIVSESLDSKISEQQYDAKTTELAKGLAKVTNKINNSADWLMWDPLTSPKKIDYLIDQYTGGIGDFLMPMNTKYAEENNMFSAKFATDSINNNKNISEFYDLQEELTKKKSSDAISEEEKYQLKYLSDINERMSDLYKTKKEIENQDMKDEEKRREANSVQKQINSLAKEAINTYEEYGEKAQKYLEDDAFIQFITKGIENEEKKEERINKMVKLYTNKDMFGSEYALENYNKDVSEKQKKAQSKGIPADDFFKAYIAYQNAEGKKNLKGETISGTKKKAQQKAIREATDLTRSQEQILYGIFNIK